jgi:hypothetical protein
MTAACDCCNTATFTEESALGACRCPDEELPADPFTALRVTFGMLLGEDDFRVLMGHPRGKQQLHGAWEHGAGVVFGLGLSYREADDQVVVATGLARDGRGRELRLESRSCLTLADWAREHAGEGKAAGWVVARYRTCLDRPVPAIADPCDVSRRHDDHSRVVESICIEIVDEPPPPWRPYPRLRALLLGPDAHTTAAVAAAAEGARSAVTGEPTEHRARALLEQFRKLAADDVAGLGPEHDDGQDAWPLPRIEENAGVVLGRIAVDLDDDGCIRSDALVLDPTVRTVLLPSSTLAELVCGFAPGILGAATRADAGGPRLLRDTVRWSRGNTCLEFCVTAPVARGSAEFGVEISSLSDDGDGWSAASVDGIRIVDDGRRVIVDLDQAPAYPTVRVIIRGTGPTPLFGRDPAVPFAGDEGGPPGTEHDGHDAVIITRPGSTGGEQR